MSTIPACARSVPSTVPSGKEPSLKTFVVHIAPFLGPQPTTFTEGIEYIMLCRTVLLLLLLSLTVRRAWPSAVELHGEDGQKTTLSEGGKPISGSTPVATQILLTSARWRFITFWDNWCTRSWKINFSSKGDTKSKCNPTTWQTGSICIRFD